MKTITRIKPLRAELEALRKKGKSIGFVPTMGALHEGHLALIRRCRKDNDVTVISIFVNPAQFGPGEDYAAYPRPKQNDLRLAREEGVDIVFSPSAEEMYPRPYRTYVDIKEITGTLCGKSRPGHFEGVATVVAKLFHIVSPRAAYFGQKDYQQTLVVRQMVKDLNLPVRIKVCPTVREKDGLAMSSRNKYLSPKHRREAAVLYRSLKTAEAKILDGERNVKKIIDFIHSSIKNNSSGVVDYAVCVDAADLSSLKTVKGDVLIAVAVGFGKARLIDNILVQTK